MRSLSIPDSKSEDTETRDIYINSNCGSALIIFPRKIPDWNFLQSTDIIYDIILQVVTPTSHSTWQEDTYTGH